MGIDFINDILYLCYSKYVVQKNKCIFLQIHGILSKCGIYFYSLYHVCVCLYILLSSCF